MSYLHHSDGGQPNIKVFYLDLEFINENGEAIIASWKQHGQSIEQVVPPKGEAFTKNALAAFQPPNPVYIEAKIGANNETVMVNGQLVFPIVYTEYLTKNVIRFGDGKILTSRNFNHFTIFFNIIAFITFLNLMVNIIHNSTKE